MKKKEMLLLNFTKTSFSIENLSSVQLFNLII